MHITRIAAKPPALRKRYDNRLRALLTFLGVRMKIEFERTALYEEVWTTPLTQLGKKYGLSDNGLRKICRAMNIPLPTAGHWAKIAAGCTVRKPPLPPKSDRTTFLSDPPSPRATSSHPDDDAWLRAMQLHDEKPENHIAIDPNPRRWHPCLARLREQLLSKVDEVASALRVAEIAAKRMLTDAERDSSFGWRFLIDHGQLLAPAHKAVPMRVSPLTLPRSLAMANAILNAAETRGFTATLNAHSTRFRIEGHGGFVEFRLIERLDEAVRLEMGRDGRIERTGSKKPTGILRLSVNSFSYSDKEFVDTGKAPLELQLNALFLHTYRRVIHCREEQRIRESAERARQEQARRRAEEEQRQREASRAADAERHRRESLATEAQDWQSARAIKEYVAHIMATAGRECQIEPRPELILWETWALQVADSLDPTGRRLQR